MKPHDNYIMHFNKNHDPRNGQFTKGSGGSSNSNGSIKTNKKKMNPTLKKVLIGAGIATGVAAAAAGAYFISKHFNQKNSITKTADNIKKNIDNITKTVDNVTKTVDNVKKDPKKILFTRGKKSWRDHIPNSDDNDNNRYHIDDKFMNKQGEVFIKGINKNKKINKYKLVGWKHLDSAGRQLINDKFEPRWEAIQRYKSHGEIKVREYDMKPGYGLKKDKKTGYIIKNLNHNVYSNEVKKIGNAVVKMMLVKRG